jgi:hypothetical protein
MASPNDIGALQQELTPILDQCLDRLPEYTGSYDYSRVLRPPRSIALFGSGIVRQFQHVRVEDWNRFEVMRIEQTARFAGKVLGNTRVFYHALWSDDVTNSGYHPPAYDVVRFEKGIVDDSANPESFERIKEIAQSYLEKAQPK